MDWDLRPAKRLCETCRNTQTRSRCVFCQEPACCHCKLDDIHVCNVPVIDIRDEEGEAYEAVDVRA